MSSERQEQNKNTPWWGEHVHRYNTTLQYILSSDKVLDIACGNGFGSYILSQKTNNIVIGGDITKETVAECTDSYANQKNLQFRVVDGTDIQFEHNYFDKIVSFETIEHTAKYKEMLLEFYRTLKNGGVAIISTPNIIINSPTGKVLNPFHTQEFTLDELSNILNSSFDDVTIFGQKYIRYNKKTVRNKIGQFIENIFYLKGIRKLPLSIQNIFINAIINKDMYPLPDDYDLVIERSEILKCKTFVAVCKKK